jgi:hypothetical protein
MRQQKPMRDADDPTFSGSAAMTTAPQPCPFCGATMIVGGTHNSPERRPVSHPPVESDDGCHLAAYYRPKYICSLALWNRRSPRLDAAWVAETMDEVTHGIYGEMLRISKQYGDSGADLDVLLTKAAAVRNEARKFGSLSHLEKGT